MSLQEQSSSSTQDCTLIKQAYEKAFLKWYETVFIPSKGTTKDMCCKQEFDEYQKCTQEWMEQKGVDQKLRKWEKRQSVE
jgi:hypothetical protein